MKVKTLKEAVSRYGTIENGKWANESKWLGLLDIPERIALGWKNSASGQPTYRIYCNKDMYLPLLEALEKVYTRGLVHELKTFDGCFCIRSVRGYSNSLSTHAFGLAIDIRAQEQPLGHVSVLSDEFVECFKSSGFIWGGDFKRLDPMHFQYADF